MSFKMTAIAILGSDDRSVTVLHGANNGVFDIAGFTIEVVRDQLADAFNLRSCDVCFVNGEEVDWTFILTAGDCLEFNQRIGQKGLGDLLTPDALMSRWNISAAEYRELQSLGLPTVRFESGEIRHPEVAVDNWMASLGGNQSFNEQTNDQLNRGFNSADSVPPLTHQFGPLIGNQKELSSWIHPDHKRDSRHLNARAVNGGVWVRTIHTRLCEVWFRTPQEFDRASKRKQRSPTQKTSSETT